MILSTVCQFLLFYEPKQPPMLSVVVSVVVSVSAVVLRPETRSSVVSVE